MKKILSGIVLFLFYTPFNTYSGTDVKSNPSVSPTSIIKKSEIVLYIMDGCPFSKKAKELLDKKGLKYNAIIVDVNNDTKMVAKLIKDTNQDTFPYVFINNKFIGGYTELKALDDGGKLN